MILADSLINGFLGSNAMGQGLVVAQLLASVVMVATIIGKSRELKFVTTATRRFLRDFSSHHDVLGYYVQRRQILMNIGIEGMYKEVCERLLKIFNPDIRATLVGHQTDEPPAALTESEVTLLRGTCEHKLDEEEIRMEGGMGIIATIVTLSPMLGLLGTVWGVLDAFAEMGTAGSANLATIAPSISSALVTTVVGLLIAIPGTIAYERLKGMIRNINADMEGFCDELSGRIACEFQVKGA